MNDSADRLLEARIGDMFSRCSRNFVPVYSGFLDEHQCALAEKICRNQCGELKYMMWGGYADAQRKMLCVYNDYYDNYIMEEIPLKCLTFFYRKEDALSHRDFLGSLMAMRLKREVIGDIITAEGEAQVFVTEVAARLICSTVSKIGKVGVRIADDVSFHLENNQEFMKICGTAASMRLDCIVGIAAGLSREKSASLIRADKVSVNHLTAASVSQEVHEGDVISVRGYGRYVLGESGGLTGKGRIHINLLKYK